MSTTRCRHGNVTETAADVMTCWECVAEDTPHRAAEEIERLRRTLREMITAQSDDGLKVTLLTARDMRDMARDALKEP